MFFRKQDMEYANDVCRAVYPLVNMVTTLYTDMLLGLCNSLKHNGNLLYHVF